MRATDFTTKEKGIAWLVGIADEPMAAKSYNVTSGMAEKIRARVRKLREEADRLTGMAAGLVVDEQERSASGHDLLANLRQAMDDQGVGSGVDRAGRRMAGGDRPRRLRRADGADARRPRRGYQADEPG